MNLYSDNSRPDYRSRRSEYWSDARKRDNPSEALDLREIDQRLFRSSQVSRYSSSPESQVPASTVDISSRLRLLRAKMRTSSSLHSSPFVPVEPLRFAHLRDAQEKSEIRPVKESGSPARVESRSSNSTSWSAESRNDEEWKSRLEKGSRNGRAEPVSLQDAFASRKKPSLKAVSTSPEDDPFVPKPKLAFDSPQIRPKTNEKSPSVPPARGFDEIAAMPSAAPSHSLQPHDDSPKPMKQCIYCERRFNIDVIMKHEDICGRQKKRPKFDSRNHRLAGLQQSGMSKPSSHLKKPEDTPIKVKKATWRDKSDQLRAAIGAARSTDPLEKRRFEDDLARATQATLTPCEFCGRSFNSDAARRHIPICRNKAMMIPRSLPGKVPLAGTGASVQMTPSRVPKMPRVLNAPSQLVPSRSPSVSAPKIALQSKFRSPSTSGSRMRF